jgi:hypothetical protein
MKTILTLMTLLGLLPAGSPASERPWQEISDPSAAEVASRFASPPPEYAVTLWWGWDGPVTQEVVRRDLDSIHARGFRSVLIEAGYGMTAKYLSPEWFDLVAYAVSQARERGMRAWVADEGKYPSGFAGGKFSAERPDLRMQALVVAESVDVASGETLERELSPNAVGALAVNRDDSSSRVLDVGSGKLRFTAPGGRWHVLTIEHQYRTSVTRAVSNPTRGKDASNSLCDYLNPAATRQFIAWTHERYKRALGADFGTTFLGFMGDEPDFAHVPWTPGILDEFEKHKGYDAQPHLAAFFAPQLTEEQKRVKADYWDVWSDIFRESFFGEIARWCAANGVEYIVHLNHEDKMMALARSEGDYFKSMRHVQVPGIDAIWNQIWPGTRADYPKYASSAAHLFGRPRAFTESFAAYRIAPTVAQAQWVINHQLARGINLVQIIWHASSASGKGGEFEGFMGEAGFPSVIEATNRASFLLAQGRPTARIAVYYPTTSLWLGDEQADTSTLAIMQQLLARQRDFDFVDEQALSLLLALEDGCFRSLSGNEYRVVLVPDASVISRAALDRLQAFAGDGGRVVFLGRKPSLVADRTLLNAGVVGNLDFVIHESKLEITSAVLAALPAPDVLLDRDARAVRYVHRRWRDADAYFFFNEGDQREEIAATLTGCGRPQLWDLSSGTIAVLSGCVELKGAWRVPMTLEPQASNFIVIGPWPLIAKSEAGEQVPRSSR